MSLLGWHVLGVAVVVKSAVVLVAVHQLVSLCQHLLGGLIRRALHDYELLLVVHRRRYVEYRMYN